ncbi:lysine N(6)-hydroxylase/L-ornithine N(5)-oxygenase family protein [Amycolatopsis sp. NBC_01488]|uniref:lysine N(6)-hydroxylase/L-ornithine N(5)-oxygenase family protein n=1 Tax=Amycolatopsis sp. NBC_01488 TaxID=2903563 RepID=UPI002E2D7162|nr:SidA/IucD/PvdA family monooxygenase [Amycolatopsis sp. NBC_01488]
MDDTSDIVAVGFGPANLALAIAVEEHNAAAAPEHRLRARFLERQPRFGWHRGMLLADATMQISFLKDLVTLRNPGSRFTFLTYLHERSRLVDFINHKTLFPTRLEFHDYLDWAAAEFADRVEYGATVTDIRPVVAGEQVVALDVVAEGPAGRVVRRARNVVIGTGIEPVLPHGITRSPRVWHSSELLDRLSGPEGRAATAFAVIGAGQSSAEVAAYLHQQVPDSQVHAIFSRYGYSPADDSPFANRVFDPAAVDEFFAAPESVKEKFLHYHGNTNYSVVDVELIEDLYRRVYRERVAGHRRLHIHHLSQVTRVDERGDGVVLRVQAMAGETGHDLAVDVVVCATGYRPMEPDVVLGGVADLCKRTGSGLFRIERDYRITTGDNVHCGIYLQGGTEHSHGLSSSLLSTSAVRAGEIVDSVAAGRKERAGVRS